MTSFPDAPAPLAAEEKSLDKLDMEEEKPETRPKRFPQFFSPKWLNFRRVFTSDRTPPVPQDVEKAEEKVEGKEEKEAGKEEGMEVKEEGKDDQPEEIQEQEKLLEKPEETSEVKADRTELEVEKKSFFRTRLLPLFQRGRKPRDVEEPQTPLELLDGGEKEQKGENAEDEKTPPPQYLKMINRRVWVLFSILAAVLVLILAIAYLNMAGGAVDIGQLVSEDGKLIKTITSCGHVQGVIEEGGYAFRGIPYAVPPTGENRWRRARTHSSLDECWNGTYLAHKRKTPCWQFYRNGSYDGSEDCLYLDVFTPRLYYDSPAPIVLFIGGESLNGGESEHLRPTARLAREKQVVFVVVSVRRSVLGFLSLPILSQSSYPMSSGNYGLSDLIASLNWIRYNGEHFGGDVNSVTVLGHAAGSSLVGGLLASPSTKGLFHGVWLSGGATTGRFVGLREAETSNGIFLREVGCSTIECLQNKSPEELLENVPYPWRPFHQDLPTRGEEKHGWLVTDGVMVRDLLEDGRALVNEVPIVAGAPADVDASPEMFSYLDWNDPSKSNAYLESKLGSFGPSLSREAADRYLRPESTPWHQFVSLLSDVRTICPLLYTTTGMARAFETKNVYFYVATQRRSTSMGVVADGEADVAGIFDVFGPKNPDEHAFVKNIQNLFYSFVSNRKLVEETPATKGLYLVGREIQKVFTYPNCDFWSNNNFFPNYSRID